MVDQTPGKKLRELLAKNHQNDDKVEIKYLNRRGQPTKKTISRAKVTNYQLRRVFS